MAPGRLLRMIAGFDRYRPVIEARLREDEGGIPLDGVRLATPVRWPNKLIAYPVNYHEHGVEMDNSAYRASSRGFFLKSPSSLSGAGEPITLPEPLGREVHHEAELAVVVGKGGRFIPRERALEHVFGYACLLDITIRGTDIERVMRKSYDSFTPIGPWIATADEVGDPGALDIRLWVGDELRQSANTREMVLDIPGQIEMAASAMTLEPGDIIATGTCAGVGPIVAGDTVTIEIERVGRMTVDVVQGQGGANLAMPRVS